MIRNIFYIGFLLVILSSCSKFEKLRKSPDNNLKYRKALEYYNKEDYDRASVLLDDISAVFRGDSKADSVNFYLAMCNYKLTYYTAAAEYFHICNQTNPYNVFAEEAEYLEAYCLYLDSPNPSLDQESTVKAIEQFQVFVKKYPESKHAPESSAFVVELQDKLVEKSFRSSKLYYDMKLYKSSIVALKSSMEEYPNTKYRENLMWMVLKSSFLLAENSIESKRKERYQATVDEYFSFVSEFPESKYKADAQKIYESSDKLAK